MCAKILRNIIVNENAFNSEGSLMHYQVRPNNNLFQLFLTLKGRPEVNSNYFSNVPRQACNEVIQP